MFANIQHSFRGIFFLEMDDLRVLKIREKCSRLTRYVGCSAESINGIDMTLFPVVVVHPQVSGV